MKLELKKNRILQGFAISCFIVFNLIAIDSLAQFDQDQEISVHLNLIRGGWEPLNFFDGYSTGLSYNRELLPYIYFHSKVSLIQLHMVDEGENGYYADRYINNGFISDAGIEFVPVYFKRFQVRFNFSGSLQHRHNSDGMDPHRFTSSQHGKKVNFFNFKSIHTGYKFELKIPLTLHNRFYLTPEAIIRSYPSGDYDIPNSFELGIQGGIQF